MFEAASAIYSDRLFTPAAEEFELAYRMRRSGIEIVLAPRIIARHDQPLDLGGICRQQYKHALGTAEVIKKYPATRSLPALDRIIRANLDPPGRFTFQSLKRAAAAFFASTPVRHALLKLIEAVQFLIPVRRLDLRLFYRAVVSAHYHAGLRDGSRKEWS
jgi:GT2 family glycosyltransferase